MTHVYQQILPPFAKIRYLLLTLSILVMVPPCLAGERSLLGHPLMSVVVLAGLSLVPVAVMVTTSFLRIAVVLAIVRSALGTQQIPPNPVIIGLALILTLFVMAPVAQEMMSEVQASIDHQPAIDFFSAKGMESWSSVAREGVEPLRRFLDQHCLSRERSLFVEFMSRNTGSEQVDESSLDTSFTVLIPAFVLSELKIAFQTGFLLFLPFLIIDMVVANILMAMGMFMVSPVMIALPFKLLLFVLADGWYWLARGLVAGYAGPGIT